MAVITAFIPMVAMASGCVGLGAPGEPDVRAVDAGAKPASKQGAEVESSSDGGDWFSHLRARWNAWRGDAYELDTRERQIESGSRLTCERDRLVRYVGGDLRYQGGGVTVDSAFVERLRRFEAVASELGERVYGRAPTRIRHFGAFACRSSRNRPMRLSEHALGNALDVSGFDFPKLPSEGAPVDLPQALQGSFRVVVGKHFNAKGSAVAERHARYLRDVVQRVRERDVFRGIVGPGYDAHDDHLHFDMAPWHYERIGVE